MLTDQERVLRIAIDSAELDARDAREEHLAKITIALLIGLYVVGIPGLLFAIRAGLAWATYLYITMFAAATTLFTCSRVALHRRRARRQARHELLAKLYRP